MSNLTNTGEIRWHDSVWRTPEGKAEAATESAKGVAAFQRQRDERKAQAIALQDRGLDANAIAKELGLSRRTVKRYLKTER